MSCVFPGVPSALQDDDGRDLEDDDSVAVVDTVLDPTATGADSMPEVVDTVAAARVRHAFVPMPDLRKLLVLLLGWCTAAHPPPLLRVLRLTLPRPTHT